MAGDFAGARLAGYLGTVVVVTIVGLALMSIRAARISTLEHAVATVVSMRTVDRPWRKSRRQVIRAQLSFKRTAKDGTVVQCQHEFEIGVPSNEYEVGDRFAVAVSPNSCQRLDILYPVHRAQ